MFSIRLALVDAKRSPSGQVRVEWGCHRRKLKSDEHLGVETDGSREHDFVDTPRDFASEADHRIEYPPYLADQGHGRVLEPALAELRLGQ